MPYFHLFINKGEVAQPPLYVDLTRDREAGSPNTVPGIYSFYVDGWQDGLFQIIHC